MAILFDDTIQARNASKPVFSGIFQVAAVQFSSLPPPSSLPPGSVMAVQDQSYNLYVNTGAAWVISNSGVGGFVPTNDVRLPPSPTQAGRVVYDTGVAYATTSVGTANQVLLGGPSPTFGAVDNALPSVFAGGTFGDARTAFIGQIVADVKGRITSIVTHAKAHVNVKDFGAKGDGVTDDRAAIQAAIDSVRDGGGSVFFPVGTYLIAAQLILSNLTGHRYDNIVLRGEGYASQIKPSVALLGGGGTGPIFFRGNGNYDLKNVGLMDLRVSGFDEQTTGTGPVVSFFGTDTTFIVNCWIDTNRDEGIYYNNPSDSKNCYITGCRIRNVGGWGSTTATNDYRAAYNVNCHNSIVVGNWAYQCGSFVEQTGAGGQWVGNVFEFAALQGNGTPTYEVGCVFESPGGASGQNGRLVIAHNTIRFALLGISLGSGSTSTVLIGHNLIENCNNGIATNSAANVVEVVGNHLYDTISGSQGYAIQCQGAGGAFVKDNQIVTGATPWAYGIWFPDPTSPAIAQDNVVYGNAVTSLMFRTDPGNPKVQWIDNQVVDWAGTVNPLRIIYRWNGADFTQTSYPGIFADVRLTAYSTRPSFLRSNAVPTAGTWKIGDVVDNTSKSATGVDYWICTSAGTPGTWTQVGLGGMAAVGGALTSASTIAPTGPIHHVTGTTTIQNITAPAGFASSGNGGRVTLVFDGVAPWNAAGNVAVAGTPTTAGTSVDFTYDNATSKWYPSRVA